MDPIKQEDDVAALFGFQQQIHAWGGAYTPPASSFQVPRLSRLSSNDFQEHDDLNSTFGDLTTPEEPPVPIHRLPSTPSKTSDFFFHRPSTSTSSSVTLPAHSATTGANATVTGDADDEDGFDSGLGSLNLTPSEKNAESVCEGLSPFWRKDSVKEEYDYKISTTTPSSNNSSNNNNQLMEVRRSRTMEYAAKASAPPLAHAPNQFDLKGREPPPPPIDVPSLIANNYLPRQRDIQGTVYCTVYLIMHK